METTGHGARGASRGHVHPSRLQCKACEGCKDPCTGSNHKMQHHQSPVRQTLTVTTVTTIGFYADEIMIRGKIFKHIFTVMKYDTILFVLGRDSSVA
jgi:hypothetical protein